MEAQARKISTRKQARRRSATPWVVILLLLLAGGAGWYFYLGGKTYFEKPAATATGPDYYTAVVRRGSIVLSASGQGTLVASQTTDLSFTSIGTLAELNVKNGDMVKSGQVLARLGNIDSLQAAVDSAQLQLLTAQQALQTLQQNSSVALVQAYQAYLKAQQAVTTAQTNDQRTTTARCTSDVTTRYLNQMNSAQDIMKNSPIDSNAYRIANGNYDLALSNYNYCTSYTPTEKTQASAALTTAQAAVQQAKKTYDTLKAASGIDPNSLAQAEAKVTQAQDALDQAKNDLAGATLTAPYDGKVVSLAATQGATVGTSKFITIADVSQATVTVSVDEADLSKLVPGSVAQVVFDQLPNQTFTGKVVEVDPQLTTQGQYQVATGTIQLDERSSKTLSSYPLGMTATITVIEKQAQNVLIVPVAAIRNLGANQYAVFVVNNGKLALRPVEVGLQDTTHAEIKSGLKDGDVVSTGSTQAN